eukprot:COSAG02_NODE_426_length_22559_cov_5.439403_1_plen_48_part_10
MSSHRVLGVEALAKLPPHQWMERCSPGDPARRHRGSSHQEHQGPRPDR